MTKTLQIEVDEILYAKIEKYIRLASEARRDQKVRDRAASVETSVVFHIDNSCDEEIRKFEKTDKDAAEKLVKEAKNKLNATKADLLDEIRIKLADAQKRNDADEVQKLIAQLVNA